MVFVGYVSKGHPIGMGRMFCSSCQSETTWVRVLQKKAFTLLFIPLFPLGRSIKVICGGCGLKQKNTEFTDDLGAAIMQQMAAGQASELNQTPAESPAPPMVAANGSTGNSCLGCGRPVKLPPGQSYCFSCREGQS